MLSCPQHPRRPSSHYLPLLGAISNIPGQPCLKRPFLFLPSASPRFKYPPIPQEQALLQYVDNLVLCSVTKETFMKDAIYLLQQLAKRGYKVPKEKLQLSLDTVHYLSHNLSVEGIQQSPESIKLIQEFHRSATALWISGSSWLCRLRAPNFSLLASSIYALKKNVSL